ncbi:hypothetical protein DSAG12_02145 [Promethearchaeum syntrophicum]|uniref:Uncharacterized protein n=1 Tax=Promethearchaeum syntrophicum TaxID=2594042 RepID=A0A5B9DBG8_9ARCH|nr:hypothetical protein [Candidatus Prometheoarchaeum syntrophicum]QEE16315.1 hypothetical protein DSAG12_02145 [Candidatus Prometheoarchaeum syntrophicum]
MGLGTTSNRSKLTQKVEKYIRQFLDENPEAAKKLVDLGVDAILDEISPKIKNFLGKFIPMNVFTEKAIDKILPNVLKKIIEQQIEVEDDKDVGTEGESVESSNVVVQKDQIQLPNILNQVKGVIKIKKTIPLNEIAEILGCEKNIIKLMIYELVGEDNLSGDFSSENEFSFNNDINGVILALTQKISIFYNQFI